MNNEHHIDPEKLRATIVTWQRKTFPHGTAQSVVSHLLEEAIELHKAPHDAEELADVVILAMGLADRNGIDLWQAVANKHAKNCARKWGKPEANGVVHHIKDASDLET